MPRLSWVIRALLLVLATAIAVVAALRFRRFAISGQSMLPTLEPGDWVLVDEFAYRSRLPHTGDIVVARDPREPTRHLVKRVAAVDLHGLICLEGDNPASSTDSREFGPIEPAALVGKVRWRYWPSSRIGALS